MNIFESLPEFITKDHRSSRPRIINKNYRAYSISSEFMYARHLAMLPPESIKGKSILDIGSCYGATGAWVLSNGASHYTGIEPQGNMANCSNELLMKYFSHDKFTIIECSLEDFVSNTKYDIIIASGVIYSYLDTMRFIRQITEICDDSIIIESSHPFNGYRDLFDNDSYRLSIHKSIKLVEVAENRPIMVDGGSNGGICCSGCFPSMASLETYFKYYGWQHDQEIFIKAGELVPDTYNIVEGSRFIMKFTPSIKSTHTFSEIFKSPSASKIPWIGHSTNQ